MKRKIDGVVLILCFLYTLSTCAAAQEIRTVMVLKNEICVKSTNGSIVRLTDDGVPKALPVWSKDGMHIAFVERTSNSVALAKLVVVDVNGQVASEMLIKPYVPGEVQTGMRYVEGLEWLNADRIAVSGTMNPSSTEYDIVDWADKTVLKQFFDDGYGAAFSADGQHYAYVSGSPHFTPADERLPSLNVDGKSVYTDTGDHLEFLDAPRWSEDANSVAILAAFRKSGQQRIILWHRGATEPFILALPSSAASLAIYWSGDDLYVTSGSSQPGISNKVWKWAGSAEPSSWVPVEKMNMLGALSKARAHREQLGKAAQLAGGTDPDFWCQACDLTILPRRSGAN